MAERKPPIKKSQSKTRAKQVEQQENTTKKKQAKQLQVKAKKEKQTQEIVKTKQVKSMQNRAKQSKADEKSARLKKMRKIKNIIKWTILIGIIVGILAFLCTSGLFDICKIEIIGNAQVAQEEILELSKIKIGDNIFLCNKIQTQSNLETHPYIQETKITRKLPDKIQIEITEKQKAYQIQVEGGYAYIDNQGYVLEISSIKIDKPILQGSVTTIENIIPGNRLNQDDLERLNDVLKIIKNSQEIQIKDKITTINMENKNNYILTLQDLKKVIYLGDTSNLANKMLYIKAIIEREVEKEGKIFVNGEFNEGFEPYFREEINY